MQRDEAARTALELLVHGVGGGTPTPQEMFNEPSPARVSGDDTAALYRHTEDADAEERPEDYRHTAITEAYVWSNPPSNNKTRALWLLLLPFMVVNLAHWMRPTARGLRRTVRTYGVLVRLVALTLTVLLVTAVCEVVLDLTAWQCAGIRECAESQGWLGFLAPGAAGGGGWWTQPGRRLGLAAAVPAAVIWLLWYLSGRTWRAYECWEPLPHRPEPEEDPRSTLGRPGFWYGRRLAARLRAAHTAAGLLTVSAAVSSPAASFDRGSGGLATLDILGWILESALVVSALIATWVVCRRGRSESRLDRRLDRAVIWLLPCAALILLALSVLYAAWDRPDWVSSGRLTGGAVFGGITLTQGLLVVVLTVVASVLYRSSPTSSTALRGLGGPAAAMLACALAGVMSGGVARVAGDWLGGGGISGQGEFNFPGPPVVLSWQTSVVPVLFVFVALVATLLVAHTLRRRHREAAQVPYDYEGERPDRVRTRRIAGARARAALTDQAPVIVGIVSAITLLLGTAAWVGALASGDLPGTAASGSPRFVEGAAQAAQALGPWLTVLGFVLFIMWGRRAYRSSTARRTIGVLWDVGTFWPRAAHPFAPPCYAERAVPDLTWRMVTWTRQTGGRLFLSGHSQGSVLAVAAAWQLSPSIRKRVVLLTCGSPLARLYGRWFPAHFGPAQLSALHREVDMWRNLYRATDPIGGPIGLAGEGAVVDHASLTDPLAYGRTERQPLPVPILGNSNYQADPVLASERATLLARAFSGSVPPQPDPVHAAVTTGQGTALLDQPGPGPGPAPGARPASGRRSRYKEGHAFARRGKPSRAPALDAGDGPAAAHATPKCQLRITRLDEGTTPSLQTVIRVRIEPEPGHPWVRHDGQSKLRIVATPMTPARVEPDTAITHPGPHNGGEFTFTPLMGGKHRIKLTIFHKASDTVLQQVEIELDVPVGLVMPSRTLEQYPPGSRGEV